MLILSTYRVALHPSYLQKVFSFIIFIKERYSFTILSEKSRAPGGGAPWWTAGEQFWIMTGICYSWDRSIFQFQTMHKSSVELGLVYKTFVSKHTWETPLLPRKTNCIHCSRNAGFFRKLNKIISQPKHTSLETFFPSSFLVLKGRALPGEIHI